ncbi:DNA (cytosine-5-)-methyltransferase [Metamycoplasma hyosynoviae]|uniref:DNA (cytosine-5-)-methyltransferase n=1 Tax=Metamycoplasma hyosynoviae TaxID=29559 RepID=UPI0023626108|nr:DNA (cytosine-5-)-methyltransferase [Metamycoplasma hyosynoviae]MDD1362128.1 DNA (cytosine-5-)-methyltransferase [Metamycoplasma hyosynoviae]
MAQRERERERERESHSDIHEINELPKNIDILTYSFPCQDISQQGLQKGITKTTRSGLLYEIERILLLNKDRLPKILLLENVKALTSKKFINDLNSWIETLNKLGYTSYYKVLNSQDYGSSQNRERIFMISIFNANGKKFNFENKTTHFKKLEDILDENYSKKLVLLNLNKYEKSDFITTKNSITKARLLNYSNFNSETYIYLPKGIGPTLTASSANSRLKFYYESNKEIRLISYYEAYEYMGFSKKYAHIIKEQDIISEEKMIFTCGNSISVEVLEKIFEELIENGFF